MKLEKTLSELETNMGWNKALIYVTSFSYLGGVTTSIGGYPLLTNIHPITQALGFLLAFFILLSSFRFKKMKWIEFIVKSIVYSGKKAILLSIVDVTKRKEVEEELKEISRLKSELFDRTSHELKTPLVTIKGYTDLLLNPNYRNLDFQTISIIEEIEQGCNRMEIIIKDLLDASKLKSSYIKLNKSEEDLSFLIRFCVNNL